ncbi:MAG: T9SS type A sorting domain-containing protein [Bacteroidia bacterium]
MAGFNWYYLGLPIDTNAQIVVGPYTTPGIYRYVALYSTQCGIFTDTVTITATQNVPVKLTRFSASKSKNDVVLNWQTASEINNDFFAIERSTNGNDFETIGYVKGSGNSASISNYRYTDIDAALNFAAYNGLFYRLNQFDFDGTNELSNIVFVDLGNNNDEKATVIPNPNNGNFDVLVSSNNQTSAILDIVDMVGNKVVSRNIELSNGLNTIYIDEILTSGVYTAIITTPHIKHSVKVVVSK